MTQDAEILFEVAGGVGRVMLNRPAALNALNLSMIRRLDPQLAEWAQDDAVHAVVIAGAGDKAFCSGGDVKSVATGDAALKRDFFREEYILNHRIHAFPKPYVSLINGIVMGGGKGLSAHGSHRVVNENVMFAMPETNIGFFPDVGGGYFLPRCPGRTGAYLALTSKRIHAADTMYIGFATHYVPLEKFRLLPDQLSEIKWDSRQKPHDQVSVILQRVAEPSPGESGVAHHRVEIDRCFSHARVEDIVASLQQEKTPWSEETLKAMHGMSPTSLKLALRQIRLGAEMSFADVMTMEYRLSQACMRGHDFYEGIRAALIDKDRQPKWLPARLEDVSDADIEACFAPLGADDLVFPD